MKRHYVLPVLAILGVCLAVLEITLNDRPETATMQGIPQLQVPFDAYVVGVGAVEAPGGNVAIGTPVSGVVSEIRVRVGDHVNVGDPLFKVDDSDLQAQLVTATAEVNEKKAALQLPRHRLEYAESLLKSDPGAISQKDLSDLRDEVAQGEAALSLATAKIEQLQLEIERHTIRARQDGEILQLRLRLGEFVEGSTSRASPLLILGPDNRMNVRVNIDEHDAWRVQPGAEALAYVRGNPALSTPLRYEYTEPLEVPKTVLTGQSTERTDTRVLQVVYSFDRADLPAHTGELLDVYIRATASSQEEGSSQ